MTIAYGESIEAMRRFSGGDPRQVHQLERDAEFLIGWAREALIVEQAIGQILQHLVRLRRTIKALATLTAKAAPG